VGGVGALILIVATYILAIILPAAIIAIFCSIVGGFAYFAYLSFILRTVRGERVSLKPFLAELKQIYGKPLLLAGAVATGLTLGVPALIGALVSGIGYLFIIPGFIGFALFTMAPFIITDNPQISYMDALKQSSGWVRAQGVDNLGAIVALVFFNVIGLIAFFFPVFITLPVSAIALADIYERRNSNA
jgi:hypothetical protein